jgi:hypothetical protein
MPAIRAPLLCLLGVLLIAEPAGAAPLRAAADAQVSAAQPRRAFGTASRMTISRRPARRAFVRFVLGAPPAAGAKVVLSLYPLRSARSGLLLRHASDKPWDERAITQRTAPRTGPQVLRTGPLVGRRWARIDVTTLVARSGFASFSLAAAGGDRVDLASRERGRTTAPSLTITGGRVPGPSTGPLSPIVHPPPAPAPVTAGPVPVDPAHPCGVAQPLARWDHVVWIVFENKAYHQVMGSAEAPYLNGLATTCSWTSNFFAEAHPSLPNYLAMTSGDTQGVTDDSSPPAHPIAAPSIFSQLGTGGWRALQESMTSDCQAGSSGEYAARHNPPLYYTAVAADCATQDVPLADPPDLSARFTFITPNLCNGMHSCSVGIGDAWLSTWIPKILTSPQYRSGATAVFITWDEDDGSLLEPIPTVVVAPSVPSGLVDGTRYDHYSLLRTTEEMLGLPPIGQAALAASMRAGLHM